MNQLDGTSVTQSATLGTNVTCGGIYATDFSCGSSRGRPDNNALSVSFDSITYFEYDGITVPGTPLTNMFSKRKMEGVIDVVFDKMAGVEERTAFLEAEMGELKKVDQQIRSEMTSQKQASHSVLFDVSVSVGAVLVCGLLAFFIKRR